jgi:hypothetical protein
MWSSDQMKMMGKFEKYMFKKMSVEHFLQKILEIDKILYVLFSVGEISIFKLLRNPNYLEENDDMAIQNYFKKFEFFSSDFFEQNKDKISETAIDPNPTQYINKMLFLNQKTSIG